VNITAHLRELPGQLVLFGKALFDDPVEAALYVPEQFSRWLHRPVHYDVNEGWGPALHEMLGVPWPCSELHASGPMWEQIHDELTAQGLAVGRWTYGRYSDADQALAAAMWCAVRHLHPVAVLETGVARGVTTRMALEAIALNGEGHLWSIDLPYLFDKSLHGQTAAAVPARHRENWTYVRGSSRRRLRPLATELGHVDLFLHDSLHTVRNMHFEMETVWSRLRPGGLMIIDDVNTSSFRDFARKVDPYLSGVFRSADGPWMFGAVRKSRAGWTSSADSSNGVSG
jgi:predicted O-methyltransferase YrrM